MGRDVVVLLANENDFDFGFDWEFWLCSSGELNVSMLG